MNIQLTSGLHLDFLERSLRETRIIEPAPGFDILVLALDIHNGTKTVAPLADWPAPYLAGNHELHVTISMTEVHGPDYDWAEIIWMAVSQGHVANCRRPANFD